MDNAGPGVEVRGDTIKDIQRRAYMHTEQGWIKISPVPDLDRDGPVRDTEKFRVEWNSFNGEERFTRHVNSVKELNEVLQPIFKEQKKNAAALRKRREQQAKRERAGRIALARGKVLDAQRALDRLEAEE